MKLNGKHVGPTPDQTGEREVCVLVFGAVAAPMGDGELSGL